MKLLLKNVTIVNSQSFHHNTIKDILIENKTITRIGKNLAVKGAEEISLENLHISVGWLDSSVCFGEPGFEERETLENGLRVAARSGFSAVCINPVTYPPTDSKAAVEFIKNAAAYSGVEVCPLGCLTEGGKGENLASLYDMHQGGAFGFVDYKRPIKNTHLLKTALEYVQTFDGLIFSYPDDISISRNKFVNESNNTTCLGFIGIPKMAEEIQVMRDISVLEYTKGRLHIPYISTKKSVELLRQAKQKKVDISCSTSIFHLFFTDAALKNFDSNFKIFPPLRDEEDIQELKKGVVDGTIDFVTSMHEPINRELKEVEFELVEAGSIGLENVFGLLNSLFTLEETVEILTRQKDRFGFKNRIIQENEEANLTLFNPDKRYTFSKKHIFSTSKNAAFIGEEMRGIAYGIFTNGQLIIQ